MASVDRQHDRDNFAVLRGGLVELKGLLNYDITSHKVLIDLSIRFLTVSPILFQQSASGSKNFLSLVASCFIAFSQCYFKLVTVSFLLTFLARVNFHLFGGYLFRE